MNYVYDVANIISIRDGKILLVKKGDFWILPGGKRNENEDIGACIIRELSEELPKSKLVGGLVYFDKFFGKSPSGKDIKVVCCFGNIEGDISPAAEISDARWISREEIFSDYKNSLSEITARIIVKLWRKKFI